MTKFNELQQIHQGLLDRMDEVTDKAAFVREAQAYVTQVCDEAVDVPAPRDRDQLRANLRYWASYLYDATGTYPNTTMRPARPVAAESPGSIAYASSPAPAPASPMPPPSAPAQSVPPPAATTPRSAAPGWRTWLVAVIIVLMLGVMYLWVRANPQTNSASGGARPGAVIVQPNTPGSSQTLILTWQVATAGPSPFSPFTWVARIELAAKGGNDEYIFWVNGQRLPEASNNQFTVESQGCQPVSQFIGVTSNGLSAKQELVIRPPEPNSCSQ